MSQNDLQFIDRALAHPWMFWVYFWKWPRIVRQACAEYDLLSKERDAAKDAHEQALRANKIVQDWIYTTHKLDMTADLRAIWTAGKRLSVLLLFLAVAMPLNAQLPPILRQYFTTNAHVLSSGAGVLTNNGVGTPGTLGWLSLSSIVGSSQIWTQDTVIHPILSSRIQIHTNGWIQAAPEVEFYSMLTNSGVIAGDFRNATGLTLDPRHGGHVGGNFTNSIDCRATAWGGGLAGGWFVSATNCYVDASDGSFASGYFSQATGSHAEASQGSYAGVESTLANNSYVEASKGSFCGADVGAANGSFLIATEGSIALAFSAYSHGCFIGSAHGSFGGGTFFEATNSFIDVFRGSIGAGDFRNSTNASITVANGAIGSGNFLQAKDSSITASAALAMVDAIGTTNGSVNASGGSVAVGILRNNERLRAIGTSVGAMAIGRNVVSTNNWTVGLNGTNDTPLSIALVNNGVQFQVTSNGNIGTVRGVSGYSWPTAHAVGALTNDGAGALGWFNGYAPATGGAYIATNSGTGWNTTFRSVSTNTVPLRIETEAGLNLTNFFQVATNGGTQPFFVISSNKFVGIGTNAPSTPLHIRPETASGTGYLRIDEPDGTHRVRIGTATGLSGFGCIWLGTATPILNSATLISDGTDVYVQSAAAGSVWLRAGGSDRWRVAASTGHFLAGLDNTYDIGASGATRPRNAYVANVTTSASFASTATNRIAITATGYTNTLTVGSIAVNVDIYFDAATAALQDSAGNVLHTFQAGTNITAHLKPNWRLVGTTMAGNAIAH